MKLLFKHSLLHQCFTQNIDTLELRAGVPPHKVVHAHGSFASQRCIDCGEPYDDDKMKVHIMEKKIAICGECAGLVKPDIVFFGESVMFSLHFDVLYYLIVPHSCLTSLQNQSQTLEWPTS